MSEFYGDPAKWMRQALTLARRERLTFPNPRVGAVLVRDGQIVGQGAHQKAGEPHAEILALRGAGGSAKGADLYVTLEPCNHHGKTPPCSEALVRAAVKNVFVGVCDPTQKAGGGIEHLRSAGIKVVTSILESDCRELIEDFAAWRQHRPYGVLKAAITADGQMADCGGKSQWITGLEARRAGHRLRASSDLVLVGKGTLLADNPRLDVRLVRGSQPARAVLCRRLPPLPADLALDPARYPVHLICEDAAGQAAAWEAAGYEVVVRAGWTEHPACLSEWMLAKGYVRFLLEGGGTVHRWALDAGLMDRIHLFVAPLLLGGQGVGVFGSAPAPGLAQAFDLRDARWHRRGKDMELTGRPKRR